MKVSEKSLELNVGAELFSLMRNDLGMSKAYLRGLTQREERQEGADFFLHLDPEARLFAFQFKAPKGSVDATPYRYTLKKEQHVALHTLAQVSSGAVFYVFPFYVTPGKLHSQVPNLSQDTWLLDIHSMTTEPLFGENETRTIYCDQGLAQVNPEFKMLNLGELPKRPVGGISVPAFAAWYGRQSEAERRPKARRNPWLFRGLRIVVALPP